MFNLTPTVRNLLIANVVLFLVQQSVIPAITRIGSLHPFGSPYLQPWQFLTYMFLHGNWGHILSNMFGLMIFGPQLEQRWGGPRFLVFWLVCGVGAGLLYQGVRYYEINKLEQARAEFRREPSGANFVEFFRENFPGKEGVEQFGAAMQRNPGNEEYIISANTSLDAIVDRSYAVGMLGASGALFGILFAFAYLFPNKEMLLFPIPIPVAAKYLVFAYAMFELYKGVHRTPGDNVAHFAHLGGMLIGFLIIRNWEGGQERFR